MVSVNQGMCTIHQSKKKVLRLATVILPYSNDSISNFIKSNKMQIRQFSYLVKLWLKLFVNQDQSARENGWKVTQLRVKYACKYTSIYHNKEAFHWGVKVKTAKNFFKRTGNITPYDLYINMKVWGSSSTIHRGVCYNVGMNQEVFKW